MKKIFMLNAEITKLNEVLELKSILIQIKMPKQLDKRTSDDYNEPIDGRRTVVAHRGLRRGFLCMVFLFLSPLHQKSARSLGRFFGIRIHHEKNHIFVRPSIALASVTSSVYSKSPPTGRPWAIRVTKIPMGLSRRAI